MPDLNPLPNQGLFEGERTADEKAYIALLPVLRSVCQFLGEHPVFVHPVPWDIGDNISSLTHVVGLGRTLDYLQNRAGKRILFGVFLKIGGILRRQNNQIGLGVTPAHSSSRKVNYALPDELAHLGRLLINIGGNVKCHSWYSFLFRPIAGRP